MPRCTLLRMTDWHEQQGEGITIYHGTGQLVSFIRHPEGLWCEARQGMSGRPTEPLQSEPRWLRPEELLALLAGPLGVDPPDERRLG